MNFEFNVVIFVTQLILNYFFQNNSSHFTLNRVKCEKQILPSVGFEPTTCYFNISLRIVRSLP